jgi:glycine cleavage system transcriptional repressor
VEQAVAEFAVMTRGLDQPGIVAAVTEVLQARGGNLLDSAMTSLRGHFVLALLVDAADNDDAGALGDALREATGEFGLTVTVERAEPGSDAEAATHLLSVYGSDHPGIVASVSRALADVGANVTDLSTRVIGAEDQPVYAMVVELSTDDESAVRDAVEATASEIGVDWTLRALDDTTY